MRNEQKRERRLVAPEPSHAPSRMLVPPHDVHREDFTRRKDRKADATPGQSSPGVIRALERSVIRKFHSPRGLDDASEIAAN